MFLHVLSKRVASAINQKDAFQDATSRKSWRGTTTNVIQSGTKKKWVQPQRLKVKAK